MSDFDYENVVILVRDTLVKAGSVFRDDKKEIYKKAIESESNDKARRVMKTILENSEDAERTHSPQSDEK